MRHAFTIIASALSAAAILVGIGIWVGTIANRVSTNETNVQKLDGHIHAIYQTMSRSQQRAARAADEAPFFRRLSLDEQRLFVDAATESETADEYRSNLAELFPDRDPAELEKAVSGWQAGGSIADSTDRLHQFLREGERDRLRQD